jgi:lipoprotein-anchoring transpeptidase ErfK/SrfK
MCIEWGDFAMTQIIFFKKLIPAIAFSALAMGACAKKAIPAESEVAWLASSTLSSTAVNQALKARVAFKVNLKTNRATLYKNGVAVDQWNIASADVSGAFHNGETQYTPTGIYAVDDLQMCPAWYPRNPVNPATGRVVRSEAERASVFANNPSVYGPCGARNPLGRYVFWFNGAYGLHGNSNESILELPSAAQRRVSGGCIRNPNAKIRTVFNSVLDSFDTLTGFKGNVAAMESRALNARWTLTKSVASLDMRVVVGNWPVDPALNSQIEGTPVAAPAVKPEVTAKPADSSSPLEIAPAPTPNPVAVSPSNEVVAPPAMNPNKQLCNIGLVESSNNIAPVYLNVPNPTSAVASFYRMGWPVTVWADVPGTNFVKVNRGFLDKKYLINCSPAS